MLGKWIDGLTDVQKDKIIQAQNWRAGALIRENGDKCLLGHACGEGEGNDFRFTSEELPMHYFNISRRYHTCTINRSIGDTFDCLVNKYGLSRIVRACKMRAAGGKLKYEIINKPSHIISDKRAELAANDRSS